MNQWNEIYKKNLKEYKYYDLSKPNSNMKELVRIFKENNIKKILDLGCGNGRNLFYLLNKGFKVFGIDSSSQAIKQIRKKLNSNLIIGNIFTILPYKDNTFDAIICTQVLQHSIERNIRKTISEIKRILKPKGLLFLTVCGRYSKGKLRYCLVKTANKIAQNTYIPTIGNEKGLTHFIYNKKILLEHFSKFKIINLWKDKRDYYCLLCQNYSPIFIE